MFGSPCSAEDPALLGNCCLLTYSDAEILETQLLIVDPDVTC